LDVFLGQSQHPPPRQFYAARRLCFWRSLSGLLGPRFEPSCYVGLSPIAPAVDEQWLRKVHFPVFKPSP